MLRVGKYLEVELAGLDPETARRQLDEACHPLPQQPRHRGLPLDLHE